MNNVTPSRTSTCGGCCVFFFRDKCDLFFLYTYRKANDSINIAVGENSFLKKRIKKKCENGVINVFVCFILFFVYHFI